MSDAGYQLEQNAQQAVDEITRLRGRGDSYTEQGDKIFWQKVVMYSTLEAG